MGKFRWHSDVRGRLDGDILTAKKRRAGAAHIHAANSRFPPGLVSIANSPIKLLTLIFKRYVALLLRIPLCPGGPQNRFDYARLT